MGTFSAWRIPVYIGWPFRSPFLNYGVLCVLCAIYLFYVAYTSESPVDRFGRHIENAPFYNRGRYSFAMWLCFVPALLFCLQYLVFDVQSINQLAQHKIQALLIAQHLEYRLAPQRIIMLPFTTNISLPQTRLALLVDQISLGAFLPFFGALALFLYNRRRHVLWRRNMPQIPAKQRERGKWLAVSLATLLGCVIFGRVPLSLLCEYQANLALAFGNYDSASQWLDEAILFDPGLNQVAYYHIQRGQVRFFVEHDNQGDDSVAYLADNAYQQGDYPTAYQELFGAWERNRTMLSAKNQNPSWIVDQISLVLMHQVEVSRPLSVFDVTDESDPLLVSAQENDKSLPILQSLVQISPTNVYARYVAGRVNYDLHAYIDCTTQMQFVNQISSNKDIQSAALTSIGLSEEGQGDLQTSRIFLQRAVALDPNYYNNVAREQLSGLH